MLLEVIESVSHS